MPAITVALLGSKELGAQLGKRGTVSDLTLYNSVRDGHALTLIEPTQFPEKFPPLLFALGMADRTLLMIGALTKEVAEAAATIDLFDKAVSVALDPAVGEDEVRRAFRGLSLEGAPMETLDLPKLRGQLEGWTAPAREGPVRIRLDHAFPVKGVGAVALGVVTQGAAHAHDKLRLFPTDKTVEVRSIQVHDVEVREAVTGERVGVALKGVEAEELARGQVLAPEGSLQVAEELQGRATRLCKYYRGKLAAGQSLHLLAGLQFVPTRVESFNGTEIGLTPDRPVAYERGEGVQIADLSATTGPRAVARATLT